MVNCWQVGRVLLRDSIKAESRIAIKRTIWSATELGWPAQRAEYFGQHLLRWSRPSNIGKFVRHNVVLLANPDTGVIIRRAHVSQLKPCYW